MALDFEDSSQVLPIKLLQLYKKQTFLRLMIFLRKIASLEGILLSFEKIDFRYIAYANIHQFAVN